MIDPKDVIEASREGSASNMPVTTARYLLEVVMNEERAEDTPQGHKEAFAKEFQRALDAGFFTALRYNRLEFDVIVREVLHIEN